jgi:hypothetical protein
VRDVASGFYGSPIVGLMNKLFVALIDAPLLGPVVRRGSATGAPPTGS